MIIPELIFRWYSVMPTKLSDRLFGGMADSWNGTPFRHLHAVKFHRSGGENRAPGMQSEEPWKSNGEFHHEFPFLSKYEC